MLLYPDEVAVIKGTLFPKGITSNVLKAIQRHSKWLHYLNLLPIIKKTHHGSDSYMFFFLLSPCVLRKMCIETLRRSIYNCYYLFLFRTYDNKHIEYINQCFENRKRCSLLKWYFVMQFLEYCHFNMYD